MFKIVYSRMLSSVVKAAFYAELLAPERYLHIRWIFLFPVDVLFDHPALGFWILLCIFLFVVSYILRCKKDFRTVIRALKSIIATDMYSHCQSITVFRYSFPDYFTTTRCLIFAWTIT